MIFDSIATTFQNNRFKFGLVIFALFGSIIVLLLVFTREQVKLEEFNFNNTNLTRNKNFGYLKGNEIYAYNGMAFYKINIEKNNNITTLYSGLKLPAPESIYWGDESGVLLNFKESFLLTEIENKIRGSGERIDKTTEDYTWYLNFQSGALKLVNKSSIEPQLAVFSENESGFYYVPSDSSAEGDSVTPAKSLRFYNIETNQDRRVLEEINTPNISHLNECPQFKVCFVAKNAEDLRKEELYGVQKNDQLTKVMENKGSIFGTNAPGLFVSVNKEDKEDSNTLTDHGVDPNKKPVRLHNLKKDATQDLGFKAGSTSSVMAHFITKNRFYALKNPLVEKTRGEVYSYRAGEISASGNAKTQLRDLIYKNNEYFSGGIIDIVSYGNKGRSLFTAYNGDQLLFARQSDRQDFTLMDKEKVKKVVDLCSQSHAQENDYFAESNRFKVFFKHTDSFERNIKSFSNCVIESNPEVLFGYNYYFGALSPVNGRIISN